MLNEKEKKLKFVRREYNRCDELNDKANIYTIVPYEKPRFAGWEVYLDLSESGKRRRDAQDILDIMNHLELNNLFFTRNVSEIREVRRNNDIGNYQKILYNKLYYLTHWNKHNKNYANIFTRNVSEYVYNSIPHKYLPYFTKYSYVVEGQKFTHYGFSDQFPFYELIFKVRKTYHTCRKVYDNEAQSEYQKLRNKLWDGSYFKYIHKAVGLENNCLYSSSKCIKQAWRNALSQIVNLDIHNEEFEDISEEIIVRKKCYNKRLLIRW